MKKLAGFSFGLLSSVHAHDGHGLDGSHWHASDSLGFIVLAIALAGALWTARRK